MRIVFLADSISNQDSGIHFYGKQLIQSLVQSFPNEDYHVICSAQIPEIQNAEQHIIPIKAFPLHLRIRQFTSISKLVNKLKPDVVVELAHFGPFGLNKGIKKVTVIHDITPLIYGEYHDYFSRITHKLLLPKILKQSDLVIVNSEQTSQDLKNYYPDIAMDKVMLYPTIDLAKNVSNERVHSRDFILTLGTIEPRKNYSNLLKAFEEIGEKCHDLDLIVIGKSGWKNSEFFKLYEKHKFKNRIILKGYEKRARLWSYLQQATLFCFPSYYEGFGIPVLEAMSIPLAIIASDIPTTRALLGEKGSYFDPNDPDQIATKIIAVYKDATVQKDLKLLSENRYKQISELNNSQIKNLHLKLVSKVKT